MGEIKLAKINIIVILEHWNGETTYFQKQIPPFPKRKTAI